VGGAAISTAMKKVLALAMKQKQGKGQKRGCPKGDGGKPSKQQKINDFFNKSSKV
jgi:hypothetical protein